jgi:hypothetical protein
MTIKRNSEKVILKDGKVSCSCCCPCSILECYLVTEAFREGIRPSRYKPPEPILDQITITYFDPSTGDESAITGSLTYHGQFGDGWAGDVGKPAAVSFLYSPTGRPSYTVWAGWMRKHFCFRFVCRIVDDTTENGKVCSGLTCGPSVNEINLTEKLFEHLGVRAGKPNLLSTETQSGLYIYCFDFFGWLKPSWSALYGTTQSVPRDDAYKLYSFYSSQTL